MDKLIDLYSRLIIATITFVGPFIIVLLSNSNSGEKRRKDLTRQTLDEITRKAKQEINQSDNLTDTIHKSSEEIKKIEKKNNNELSRLDPIKQFWLIYGFLALSFILLCFKYITKDETEFLKLNLSITILILSSISYSISVFFIIRTFYTIINTKKLIDN